MLYIVLDGVINMQWARLRGEWSAVSYPNGRRAGAIFPVRDTLRPVPEGEETRRRHSYRILRLARC